MALEQVVLAALEEVDAGGSDVADVAMRLAVRVDRDGASPSTVRELRYALLAIGVVDLAPFRALMVATKAAIDASDERLPSLATQLREIEQTCRRLSSEPVNAPTASAVRAAVDDLVAEREERWEEFV